MFKNGLIAVCLAGVMTCLLACGEGNIGSLIKQEAEDIVFRTEEDPDRDYNPHMGNLSPAEMTEFIIKSLKEENSVAYFEKKVVDIQVTIPNSSEHIEGYRNTDYSKIIYYKKQDEIRRISGITTGTPIVVPTQDITVLSQPLTVTVQERNITVQEQQATAEPEIQDTTIKVPEHDIKVPSQDLTVPSQDFQVPSQPLTVTVPPREVIIREYQIVGTIFELIPADSIVQAKLEEGQTYILRVRITDILLQPISVGSTSIVYFIECILWDDAIFQAPEPEKQQDRTDER